MALGKTGAGPSSGEFQVEPDQARKKEAMLEMRRGGEEGERKNDATGIAKQSLL